MAGAHFRAAALGFAHQCSAQNMPRRRALALIEWLTGAKKPLWQNWQGFCLVISEAAPSRWLCAGLDPQSLAGRIRSVRNEVGAGGLWRYKAGDCA